MPPSGPPLPAATLHPAPPNSDRVAVLAAMLRDLSVADSAEHAFGIYMDHLWQVEPVDHYLEVSVQDLPPGHYRVVANFRLRDVLRHARPQTAGKPDLLDRLPIHTGDWVADLIRLRHSPAPFEIHPAAHPPHLAGDLQGLVRGLALPIFRDGRIAEWAFALSSRPETSGFRMSLEEAFVHANLLSAHNAKLDFLRTVRSLNSRLRTQLERVAQIQTSLLPARLPSIPGARLATAYLTSDEAGGDYYDFFRLPGGRWAILVADASGHGADAAVVMAMVRTILHASPTLAGGPAATLRHLNAQLVGARLDAMFVTAVLVHYDPSDGSLVHARAAHPEPRVKRAASGHAGPLASDEASIPLGLEPDLRIGETADRLHPGDTLVLYTDGITEAFSPERRMFGESGLDAALARCSGEVDCVVDTVHTALFNHTGLRTRADDQTLVVLQRLAATP